MLKLANLLIVLGLMASPTMALHTPTTTSHLIASTPIDKSLQKNWPSYLIALVNAQILDDSHLGVAATPSPLYQAFEQAQSAGLDIYPLLQAAFPEVTPAGKIYIVRLIQQVNPREGRRLWQKLQSDQSVVQSQSGCIVSKEIVSEIATRWLQKK